MSFSLGDYSSREFMGIVYSLYYDIARYTNMAEYPGIVPSQ